MLRKAVIALIAAILCSKLVLPQAASAEMEIRGRRGHPHRSVDMVPWFLLDGATRLGVFPRLYVSEYYPYYMYQTVYSHGAYIDFVGSCQTMRPVADGWRTRTVQICE